MPKDNLTGRCYIVDNSCLLTEPASYLIHKTQVDKKSWAKPDAYAAYVHVMVYFHIDLTLDSQMGEGESSGRRKCRCGEYSQFLRATLP